MIYLDMDPEESLAEQTYPVPSFLLLQIRLLRLHLHLHLHLLLWLLWRRILATHLISYLNILILLLFFWVANLVNVTSPRLSIPISFLVLFQPLVSHALKTLVDLVVNLRITLCLIFFELLEVFHMEEMQIRCLRLDRWWRCWGGGILRME